MHAPVRALSTPEEHTCNMRPYYLAASAYRTVGQADGFGSRLRVVSL